MDGRWGSGPVSANQSRTGSRSPRLSAIRAGFNPDAVVAPDHRAIGVRTEKRFVLARRSRFRPLEHDDFALMPKQSAFLRTTLDIMLDDLDVETSILAGDTCVLFTAKDTCMRDFSRVIPADCVASDTSDDNRVALEVTSKVLKADIRRSAEVDPLKRGEVWSRAPKGQCARFAGL